MQQLTQINGAPVVANPNAPVAGSRAQALAQGLRRRVTLAPLDCEVISAQPTHARGSGALADAMVTDDIAPPATQRSIRRTAATGPERPNGSAADSTSPFRSPQEESS